MYGRRFLKVAKDLSKYKLETMITRKHLKRNAHPRVLRKLQKTLKPPEPLKYKLQELPKPDTTWNIPLGKTNNLPFFVIYHFYEIGPENNF